MCKATISASLSSVSFSTIVTPGTCFGVRFQAITLHPKACTNAAVRCPIAPNPIMPTVLPAISRPGAIDRPLQLLVILSFSIT